MMILKKPGRVIGVIHRAYCHNRLISLFFLISMLLWVQIPLSTAETGSAEKLKASSPEFCPAIQEIIQSSKKRFKSIRGKLDLVSEEYFGKLLPPGLKTCFAWLDGRAYHCSSQAGMTEDEVGVVYERFNAVLQQCLTDRWQTKEVNLKRSNGRRFTTYTSTSAPVEIKVGERNKRLGWYIDLYFRRY